MAADAVREDRLARAEAGLRSSSARARRKAVIAVAALGGAGAYEPLIDALRDTDRKVRFNAMLGLATRDAPEDYASRIVDGLAARDPVGDPEAVAAAEVVRLRVGPGVITRLGLSQRLLPHIEKGATAAEGWRFRRQARFVARSLRERSA